ncbi:MAG: biopolymer transporter ExbD [Bacteroidetes bacterium]|nr:biopolymer transporter ExbD [Bdellovibrionales bacterium]MCB0739274.1 biopolymer transporter ExbD [Bacteroidota bacterium]
MRRRSVDFDEGSHELNLVPYMDIMVNLVLFMLYNITSFLSFTVLNASIPQLTPDAGQAAAQVQKKSLLLMVRVTDGGFTVDPSVQGGPQLKRVQIPKNSKGFDYKGLQRQANVIKSQFPEETKVLLIAEGSIIYDNIIKSMDALREDRSNNKEPKALFPDVTLSIL